MDLQSAVASIRQHFEQAQAEVKAKLEQELPFLGGVAEKAAANPALAALLDAVHLTEVPEFLATIADLVTKADAALAAAKAQGAAEAAAAAQAPAEAEAEPVPAS